MSKVALQFTVNGSDTYSIPKEEFEDWTLGMLMDEVRGIAAREGETPDEVQPSSVDMRFTGMDMDAGPDQPHLPSGSVRQTIFENDMRAAGLEVRHYRTGPFFEGPAIFARNLQHALSFTQVPCYWQNLGSGWIIYPEPEE